MKKVLLIMPPFWDPICPPQGLVSLKSYLDSKGYDVTIADFNTDGPLFRLQQDYFNLLTEHFPHWEFLNIPRNGPRYFARHQLVWFHSNQHTAKYKELVRLILNFDGKSACSDDLIERLDSIISEIFSIVTSKTIELMDELSPDMVGCTMLESTFPSGLAILKKVKEMSPGTATVLGGPGIVTGNMVDDGNLQRITEKCGWIDAVIYGEGERVLESYLEGKLNGKKILTVNDLADEQLMALNDMPMPTYEGLSAIKYLWLSVFSSRGCPFKCAFCYEKDYWVRFRKKQLEKVIEEMKDLSGRYGRNKLFYLCDSLANHIATPLSKAIIEKKEKLRWDCYMRITPECLDSEKVKLWADGGMERARIGVESGSPQVLELMNKDISTDQIKEGLKNFAEAGICTSTLWIAGFPGETDENFRESMNFLEENSGLIYQADIWEFISMPREAGPTEDSGNNFSTTPLYPEEFDDMLLIRYYDQESVGLSPERFEKISRFEKLRIKLGVPNPYTLKDLLAANKRWAQLGHKKR